jgi:hypothetical protein
MYLLANNTNDRKNWVHETTQVNRVAATEVNILLRWYQKYLM